MNRVNRRAGARGLNFRNSRTRLAQLTLACRNVGSILLLVGFHSEFHMVPLGP
jgi:hypothetical protein